MFIVTLLISACSRRKPEICELSGAAEGNGIYHRRLDRFAPGVVPVCIVDRGANATLFIETFDVVGRIDGSIDGTSFRVHENARGELLSSISHYAHQGSALSLTIAVPACPSVTCGRDYSETTLYAEYQCRALHDPSPRSGEIQDCLDR